MWRLCEEVDSKGLFILQYGREQQARTHFYNQGFVFVLPFHTCALENKMATSQQQEEQRLRLLYLVQQEKGVCDQQGQDQGWGVQNMHSEHQTSSRSAFLAVSFTAVGATVEQTVKNFGRYGHSRTDDDIGHTDAASI